MDRGKPGTKRHLVRDARGTPLGLTLSGANRRDSRMLMPTLNAVAGVRARHRGVRVAGPLNSTPIKPTVTAVTAASAGPRRTIPRIPRRDVERALAWAVTGG